MEYFFEDLRQFVHCSLCNQTLQEPKLLQCFHTFCKSCIQRHAQPKEQGNIFNCPKCSSETLLQEQIDVEDLQPSLLHSKMLQVLAFSESEKSCSVSATHSTALWHCLDCDRSLCDECLKYHSTFIKDHRVVSFSELKKEDLESMVRRLSPCKIHSSHTLELFCKECDILVCLLCLKDDHNGHKTQNLQEVNAIKKDLLSKTLEEIEKLQSNEIEMKQQEEISINMIKDGEKAKKEVQKMTKKLVKCLLDQEQQLLNEIQRSVAKADKNLHIIRHTAAAKEYIKIIMANGIASAVDMDYHVKTFTYDPFHSDTSRFIFCPDEDVDQQVTNAKLGHVRITLKSNSMLSKIEVDSDLMALAKVKLSVVIKTSTGTLNYDDSDLVDIQISPENDLKIKEKTVKTGGKIQIEFVPRVSGQLTAEVKLNGIPVSNSPLVMDVKPQNIVKIMDSKLKIAFNTGSRVFTGIAVNKTNSRIAVADWSSHCVRVFNMDGVLLLTYGGKARLSYPQGLAFLNDVDLVIADSNNHRICIVNTTTGTLIKTFGRQGNGNGEFFNPRTIHVDDDCNIIVSDANNSRVEVFTRNGDYRYQFTVPNQDDFRPYSTVTHNGLFYVSDCNNGVIHVIQMKDGSPTRISTIGEKGDGVGQLQWPYGLVIDNDHNLLVCDFNAKVITKFTLDGRVVGQTSKYEYGPRYIAVLNNGQFVCSSYDSKGKGCVTFYQNEQQEQQEMFSFGNYRGCFGFSEISKFSKCYE